MYLPIIKKRTKYKRSIINFGGINVKGDYSVGEMRDCTGITHSDFPFITQRKKGKTIFECNTPTAVVPGNKECIAAEDGLYYNRKKVGDLSSGKKQLAVLGNFVVVFPDKVYYDTEKDVFKSLSGETTTDGARVTFTENSISVQANFYETVEENDSMVFHKSMMIRTYGKASVSEGKVALTEFSLKEAGALEPGIIFQENCEKNQYRIVESVSCLEDSETYKVECILVSVRSMPADLFSHFNEDDIVEISGCSVKPENNCEGIILSVNGTSVTFTSNIFTAGTEIGKITIKRKIPDLTSVCVYENRLWGVEGNTIYGSALGDATAFYRYKGISTDSFTVASNSAGDFTACVAFGNSCFFFKEDSCYKLYGNRPANFQLNENFAVGVLENDAGSIARAGDRLIYKGNGGIYSFYGGASNRVSDNLGDIKMENAVAGSNGKLYYLSADTENGREEFVWDVEKNLWCKSGVLDVLGYASYGENMYRLRKNGVEQITSETDEEAEWSITLCPLDEGYYNTKNYSGIRIKAQLYDGAYISTEVKIDGGNWRTIDISHGDKKHYLDIPCRIKGCHELQLRISGKGRSTLESITREFSVN